MPASASVGTKMMPGTITILWVPIEKAATPTEVLKAATLKDPATVDLSCAIVTGFTLNATDSETDSTASICDTAGVSTPTRDAYEANLTFFRQDLQAADAATSVYTKAYELFKKGGAKANKRGWLVKRVGYPQGTPIAKDQEVSAFLVMPDNPQDVSSDATTPIQFTVPFLPQGTMILNEKVTE